MKNFLLYVVKLFIFWMLLFFIERNIFLLYQMNELRGISLTEYILINRHALLLDLSTYAYIMAIPSMILYILFFKDYRILKKTVNIYFISIIIFFSLINMIDYELYAQWGSRINQKAIASLAYPREAMISSSSSPVLLLIGIFAVKSVLFIFFYKKLIGFPKGFKMHTALSVIWALVFSFIIFTAARGGYAMYPVGKSSSYFSIKPALNQTATNGFWSFVYAVANSGGYKSNPYKYFTTEEADSLVKSLNINAKDTTVNIFNIEKPNIVLIMLESWSGDATGALGNKEPITPQFDTLAKHGLLFTNFYSTGFRTAQGLAAIVSGFPSQPLTEIIKKFGKFELLPGIVHEIDKKGYQSAFYYGGALEYANTLSYLKSMGFTRIKGLGDYSYDKRTKWGVMDEGLFNFINSDLVNNPEPFFALTITLTNHEPFDAEVDQVFGNENIEQRFKNTMHYTDACLGSFINKAAQQPWYKKTVFVITSDHSHFLPYNRAAYEYKRHWVPLLIFGEPLKETYQGKTIDKVGTHADIAATLLAQLKLTSEKFRWSKNLLNPTQAGYAFYTFNNGFGWVTSDQAVVYDHNAGRVIYTLSDTVSPNKTKQYLNNGKATLQCLIDEYIGFTK